MGVVVDVEVLRAVPIGPKKKPGDPESNVAAGEIRPICLARRNFTGGRRELAAGRLKTLHSARLFSKPAKAGRHPHRSRMIIEKFHAFPKEIRLIQIVIAKPTEISSAHLSHG